MRLFIAIPFDDNFKSALRDVQDRLKARGVRGNYTRSDNLHLTLAFIGEFDDPEFVLRTMKTVSFRPFTLKLSESGNFGDIVWCGVGDCPELASLAGKLRRALTVAGIPFDQKKFNPHVTILRKCSLPGVISQADAKPAEVEMRVERFSLMESSRDGNGVLVYTQLGSAVAGFS